MCRCQPQMRTPWCPNCCEHDGSTHCLDKPWPTGEAIEVCELCGMSRAHWEEGVSEWCEVDLVEGRRELEEAIAAPSLGSVITYACDCGHVMLVSVAKVDQKRDETRTCDECGSDAAWDEFTVDGPDDPYGRRWEYRLE